MQFAKPKKLFSPKRRSRSEAKGLETSFNL
jgi:hypothetical protein